MKHLKRINELFDSEELKNNTDIINKEDYMRSPKTIVNTKLLALVKDNPELNEFSLLSKKDGQNEVYNFSIDDGDDQVTLTILFIRDLINVVVIKRDIYEDNMENWDIKEFSIDNNKDLSKVVKEFIKLTIELGLINRNFSSLN